MSTNSIHFYKAVDKRTQAVKLCEKGQLSVSGERMCTILINRFRGLSLLSKGVVNKIFVSFQPLLCLGALFQK